MPLDPRWSIVDPIGDCAFSETGGQAVISIPATVIHDEWQSALNAPKILQVANNTDFDIKTKITSALSTTKRQGAGIWVGNDANNFLRFNVHSVGDGTSTYRCFAAYFVAGVPTTEFNSNITGANPIWLRVNRTGNTWTFYTSTDGSSWTTRDTFSHTISVTKAGLFALTGVSVSAFDATFDNFIIDDLSAPGAWVDQFESVTPTDLVDLGTEANINISRTETVTPADSNNTQKAVSLNIAQTESITISDLIDLFRENQSLDLLTVEILSATDDVNFRLVLYDQSVWQTQIKQTGVNDPNDPINDPLIDTWTTQQPSNEPTV